ncbi:hypothetical protein Pcinc_001622 [Petrolisthes cinctipes]|uniref:Uncharacterized protein n=1 Tax=Petrolisthes cinctipes TaxID=88211 RepID=A0AAE1GKF3_PETCI|nr:hypothetical protein Pcinc_001622 [Petrolisthes cinctipes]
MSPAAHTSPTCSFSSPRYTSPPHPCPHFFLLLPHRRPSSPTTFLHSITPVSPPSFSHPLRPPLHNPHTALPSPMTAVHRTEYRWYIFTVSTSHHSTTLVSYRLLLLSGNSMATPIDTPYNNMSLPHASYSPPHVTAQPASTVILYTPPFNYDVHAWFLHVEAVWQGLNLTQDQ